MVTVVPSHVQCAHHTSKTSASQPMVLVIAVQDLWVTTVIKVLNMF